MENIRTTIASLANNTYSVAGHSEVFGTPFLEQMSVLTKCDHMHHRPRIRRDTSSMGCQSKQGFLDSQDLVPVKGLLRPTERG